MRKVGMLMVTALAASLLAGCGYKASDKKEEVTITVFAAKSLNPVSYTHLTLPTTPYV